MPKPSGHEATIIKRASRRHDEDDHGGSWKVAFADFCLALMCLFMVLWVLAAREQEDLKTKLEAPGASFIAEGNGRIFETASGPRGSLIERFPMPSRGEGGVPNAEPGLRRTRYDSPAQMESLAQVLAKLSQEAGLQANVQTVITPYGLRVMLHDTDNEGMFQLGSAVPSGKFHGLLLKMGPLFAQIENQILIVGHTDAVQFAGGGNRGRSNWTLSSERAASARSSLLDGGMPQANVLQVVGMADRAPFSSEDPLASINRRIEMLILTGGQSAAITAMFGPATQSEDLFKDVQGELPSGDVLKSLRDSILKASQLVPGLQARASSVEPVKLP